MKVLVAYSGGKDSQASLIWAVLKYGNKNVEAVFCDTGWEHPETYKHIKDTCQQLRVKLITVKSLKYNGMLDLAKQKGRFPSNKARFCTEELKTRPFIDYVLNHQENLLIIQGIRSSESFSRSQMEKQCTYFKYYFEPYSSNEITIKNTEDRIKEGKKLTNLQLKKYSKAKKRLSEGHSDKKFHTYRKKEVFDFVEKYSQDIIRPFFEESGMYVITYILDNGQLPNPLYYTGNKRVGCYPCFMSGHKEVLQISIRDPNRLDFIQEQEDDLGSSFFKIDYIPVWARTGKCKKTGKTFTKAIDVKKYLTSKNSTGDLFVDDPSIACSSYYSLCE